MAQVTAVITPPSNLSDGGDAASTDKVLVSRGGVLRTVAAQLVADLSVSHATYSSRAIFEASEVLAPVVRVSVLTPGGDAIHYKRDAAGTAATTNGGTVNWSPEGVATPNHWAENTTPATTDMTTAIQAAVNHGDKCRVEFLAEEYLISSTITVTGREDTLFFEEYSLIGAGPEATTIIQSDPTQDHISISTLDPINNDTWLIGVVEGFRLKSTGATQAQTGAGIRHNRNLNTTFRDLLITGPTNIIISEGSAQCYYNRVFSRGTDRASGENLESVYTFTDNGRNRSFGNFIGDCEHQAGEVAERIFDIQAVDGLYVSNCHFNSALKKVHIRPDGTANLQDHVFQLKFTNVYFDGDGSPEDGVYVAATGGTTRIEGMLFSNCHFRVGSNSVFTIGQTAGEVAGLSTLQDIVFNGCHIKQFEGRIFDLSHPTLASPKTVIENFEVNGGIIEDGPLVRTGAVNAATLQGTNLKFQGVTIQGGWDNTGEYVISVQADAENVMIAHNTMDVARTGDPVTISASATNAYDIGNTSTANPRSYYMNATVRIGHTGAHGLEIDGRTLATDSDIVLRDNSVVNSEDSLTFGVEGAGYFRWLTGVTDAETGTAGGTERFRVNTTGAEVTGRLMLDDSPIGGGAVSVANDSVQTVAMPSGKTGAFVVVNAKSTGGDPQNAHSCFFRADAGASAFAASVYAGGNVTITTGTLSGTTGTAGNTTVAPDTSGGIQIENRRGSTTEYEVVFL